MNTIMIRHLTPAIAKASGEGQYRFSLRQLYYAMRPFLLQMAGAEPSYNWFCQVITDYKNDQGHDIRGIYRDDRGTLYHPHLRQEFPLGTFTAENYQRPAWTFNKILYAEF